MNSRTAANPSLSDHDHEHCIGRALQAAEEVCAQRKVRLTAIRRRVLELVWQSHAPIGAYELLAHLAAERGQVAPPTVYRALDFLAGQGLVHRIDTLNAFVGCAHPHAGHKAYFLICRDCRQAEELADHAVDRAIAAASELVGFTVESETVEIRGLCRACRCAAPPPRPVAAVSLG